jgi:putative restriction endonuclease
MPILDKRQLHEKIVESIQSAGWNVIYISPLNSRPFNIRIYNENESYMLKIYIWNLTHGGKTRSRDEYRIQVKVERFQQEIGYKTLVLGWWDDVGVFGGFDVRRHGGHLGYSSSIQISREALRRASINSVSAHDKGNNEIAIAFTPEFFVDYVRNLELLHGFGDSVDDLERLETVIEQAQDESVILNESDFEQVSSVRQSVVKIVTQKVRQSGFQKRVLTAYNYRCAFCSIQLKLVDAAHIIPVAHETSNDFTSNGLTLCPLHHRAYDKALITIDETYQTLVNENKMQYLQTIGHDGGMEKFCKDLRPIIHLPPAVHDRPNINYIRKANKLRGWR